jgi:ribonuclease HIII
MVTLEKIDKETLKKLLKHGFAQLKVKSRYEDMRFKGPCTVISYKTGKVLIQGDSNEVDKAQALLAGLSEPKFRKSTVAGYAVGTDEALKGDTFGGIVVCGFLADDAARPDLKAMGVKDSKKLNNTQVCEIAEAIMKKYPDSYSVRSLLPEEYNRMISRTDNVTALLDELHKDCFNKLKGSTHAKHIVDKYPGCSVGDICETQAESKFLEVAAASVLARYFALKQIMELEKSAGLFLPLGSTHVDMALLQLEKKHLNPNLYVKMSFSNVKKYFNSH